MSVDELAQVKVDDRASRSSAPGDRRHGALLAAAHGSTRSIFARACGRWHRLVARWCRWPGASAGAGARRWSCCATFPDRWTVIRACCCSSCTRSRTIAIGCTCCCSAHGSPTLHGTCVSATSTSPSHASARRCPTGRAARASAPAWPSSTAAGRGGLLGQGAIVLLISDGLDSDVGDGLAHEMERLHKSCRRLIWLNPLLRYEGFEPRPAGIRAMLPYVDEFLPVHNLDSLKQLAAAFARRSFAGARRGALQNGSIGRRGSRHGNERQSRGARQRRSDVEGAQRSRGTQGVHSPAASPSNASPTTNIARR